MVDAIYNIPSFLLFIFIALICCSLASLAVLTIRRHVPLKFRYDENQAIICVSALIGIIYAILVGFTVLYELDNYDKADQAESEEAKQMFAIFRMAYILPEPSSSKIRALAVSYAENAIHYEWPMMALGKTVNKTGVTLIENIAKEIRSFNDFKKASPIQVNALNTLSLATSNLFDLHQERIVKIHSDLNQNIWFVLLLATFLTIGINVLLGMELRLHLVCVIAISLIVSSVLYLIITIDRPYRGDFSVKPDTFEATLDYLK